MNKNMGSLDRGLRIIVAAILGAMLYSGWISGNIATAGAVVAIIFLLTSLVGFCPAYRLIGINTCRS